MKILQITPKGYVYVAALLQYHPFGWVDATCWEKFISFLKLEPNEAGDFHSMFCCKFNHDSTWEVIITDISLNPDTFSTFPKL